MTRNKEYRELISIISGVVLVNTIGAFIFSKQAGWLALAAGLVLVCVIDLYHRRRYQKLQELSAYLRQICSGDYQMDIRDNKEGELSILKNEIYKVMLRLSEQAELLKKDKLYLADAISDISHQLKTPLTSMMVMTELIEEGGLSEEKRRTFTRKIKRQLERIEWLVSALLKLSKIDAGTIHFKKESISAQKVIQKALEPLLIPMELKCQQLHMTGENVSFIGDFNWSREAFVNILKNCVEHTPEGGEIHVSFVENPLYSEVEIVDNGEGIDPEDLPNIFKRFYRGKNAGSESIGIGLAMARSIIVQQNGDIKVESIRGKGTHFKVRFYKGVV